jgi:hypothetical protein
MSKTVEIKVAEQLVNLTDDHWFNPTIFGRYLADQPVYTIDRVMEMLASVISEIDKVYELLKVSGTSSEGLLLANELNECIKAYMEVNVISNLKLPKPVVYNRKIGEPNGSSYKYSWLHDEGNLSSDRLNVIPVAL